ncbi:penicillin-binding protein 2 [Calderihabitans maritimus]|nr:penicillin-binding protein 2 [Calderihabitans maritimus]
MADKAIERKLTVYLILIILMFIFLVARLFFLQVVQAQEFEMQSRENRIRSLRIPARRGDILDRNGQVLATSKPVFSVSISSSLRGEEQEEVIRRLVEILNDPKITVETVKAKVKEHRPRYEPVEIKRIPWGTEAWEVITRIEERRAELPGVIIEAAPMRYYPNGSLAGHILGFIGQINEQELETYREYNYELNDKIGKTGLEKVFELWKDEPRIIGLRGRKGFRQVEVNVRDQIVRELPGAIAPVPGDSLILTLDIDLQRVLEDAMDEVIADIKEENPKAGAGAAVVLDVRTGAILAMASKPEMNPNDFVDGSYQEKKSYYNDPKLRPAFNRVVQGTYPPGSTFKPITAMAALEAGLDPSFTVNCTGRYWRPPYIKCWKPHGIVNLYQAIAVSCNTYFQEAGYRTGIDKIVQVAQEFGLGSKTGVQGILGEEAGILPSPQWKEEVVARTIQQRFQERRKKLEEVYTQKLMQATTYEERDRILEEQEQRMRQLNLEYQIQLNWEKKWHPYDTFNTAIGQGANSYTVIQLANYVATLANGGNRWRPYLVHQIVSPEGKVIKTFEPELLGQVSVSPETMAHVRRGMRAVTEPGGTAYFLFKDFPPELAVAAKTGTAQTGRSGDDPKKDFHGLFIAFAPADAPEIAFAGIIEYGGNGSSSAGKVARAVFAEYFGLQLEENVMTSDVVSE